MSRRQPPELIAERPVSTAATSDLTQDEKRLLDLFRATTDQQMLLGIAGVCVDTKPRHTRPALHLVHGGPA